LQNKNLCFGFDILNKLLTFFVLDKANLLWHSCPMTKEIQWSQCEMQWNMPSILIILNLFKTSIGISTSYMTLKSIHISIWKIVIWNKKFYFNFEYFNFNMKVHISIWKYYFNLKNWFSIM
jgi:hypothetical protein